MKSIALGGRGPKVLISMKAKRDQVMIAMKGEGNRGGGKVNLKNQNLPGTDMTKKVMTVGLRDIGIKVTMMGIGINTTQKDTDIEVIGIGLRNQVTETNDAIRAHPTKQTTIYSRAIHQP